MATRTQSDRSSTSATRTRSANTGGPRLKLSVRGVIEGRHMYWANDDKAEIEQLLHEGFRFVTPVEAEMESWIVEDKDVSDKVSKYVGTKEDGSPLRAYLLCCTDEVWDERQAMGLEQADIWDDSILNGTAGAPEGTYRPTGTEISVRRV